jgi:putative ABC transport system permease protein
LKLGRAERHRAAVSARRQFHSVATESRLILSLLENGGAVVAPLLLEDLAVKIGDKIKIGEAEFQIRATFDEEPGGASGFRSDRAFSSRKKRLTKPELRPAADESGEEFFIALRTIRPNSSKAFARKFQRHDFNRQSYRETQENLGEQFERTENYLSLTGLLILVLGGVGVWNVARVFVEQKRKSVAVLKCLGASGTQNYYGLSFANFNARI